MQQPLEVFGSVHHLTNLTPAFAKPPEDNRRVPQLLRSSELFDRLRTVVAVGQLHSFDSEVSCGGGVRRAWFFGPAGCTDEQQGGNARNHAETRICTKRVSCSAAGWIGFHDGSHL